MKRQHSSPSMSASRSVGVRGQPSGANLLKTPAPLSDEKSRSSCAELLTSDQLAAESCHHGFQVLVSPPKVESQRNGFLLLARLRQPFANCQSENASPLPISRTRLGGQAGGQSRILTALHLSSQRRDSMWKSGTDPVTIHLRWVPTPPPQEMVSACFCGCDPFVPSSDRPLAQEMFPRCVRRTGRTGSKTCAFEPGWNRGLGEMVKKCRGEENGGLVGSCKGSPRLTRVGHPDGRGHPGREDGA